ncbi:MAG: FAD-dependent oxidoreductase, partial [Microcystaceae cyanobacterium]
WIAKSGLHTDDRGFILIDSTLRSLSHPQIFATGDIASLVNHPRPKAGVFAVRQGQPLFVNLQNLIQGQALKSYYPQKNHLSLIGTGDKKAIAVWGNWAYQSSLFWQWKNYIDCHFMSQFQLVTPKKTDR